MLVFPKGSRASYPSGKDGFMKGIHCLELMSIFVNYLCHPSPKGKYAGCYKGVVLLERSLVNCSVALLKKKQQKKTVTATQTGASHC